MFDGHWLDSCEADVGVVAGGVEPGHGAAPAPDAPPDWLPDDVPDDGDWDGDVVEQGDDSGYFDGTDSSLPHLHLPCAPELLGFSQPQGEGWQHPVGDPRYGGGSILDVVPGGHPGWAGTGSGTSNTTQLTWTSVGIAGHSTQEPREAGQSEHTADPFPVAPLCTGALRALSVRHGTADVVALDRGGHLSRANQGQAPGDRLRPEHRLLA